MRLTIRKENVVLSKQETVSKALQRILDWEKTLKSEREILFKKVGLIQKRMLDVNKHFSSIGGMEEEIKELRNEIKEIKLVMDLDPEESNDDDDCLETISDLESMIKDRKTEIKREKKSVIKIYKQTKEETDLFKKDVAKYECKYVLYKYEYALY